VVFVRVGRDRCSIFLYRDFQLVASFPDDGRGLAEVPVVDEHIQIAGRTCRQIVVDGGSQHNTLEWHGRDALVFECFEHADEDMRRSLDPAITEEYAEEAILQLRDKKLVNTSGSSSQGSRRQFLATLGAVAVPLVVCLTVADQKAHAVVARSAPRTTPPPALAHLSPAAPATSAPITKTNFAALAKATSALTVKRICALRSVEYLPFRSSRIWLQHSGGNKMP
jgi:hypothetical protein